MNSKVGIGTYRMSYKSKAHREALIYSIENNCSLIDTSSNYTDGESEILIGEVLRELNKRPIIVTKAGYIQGKNFKNLEELRLNNKAIEDLVIISENLNHSIHPEFLSNQLDQSLNRMKIDYIDYFLLHNPEYYFNQVNASEEEYYNRIKKAFIYLESEVEKGRIKFYGISSNNFILPLGNKEVTSLERILKIAQSLKKDHHFKVIQFPLNLIEIGALEKYGEYGETSLIELAKLNNLITISNRPLNAFTNNQLVRLATYEFLTDNFNIENARKHFDYCRKAIEEKWIQEREDETDDLNEVTIYKQFLEIWDKLPSPDAVDQVYFGHFFPFIASIWGKDLTKEESEPFYCLYDYSILFSRIEMTKKAIQFRDQARSVKLLDSDSRKLFSVDVIETYLNYGIDYVLVGMRDINYVDQLKHLF